MIVMMAVAGGVCVHRKQGKKWSNCTLVLPPKYWTLGSIYYGTSVALSGDGNTLAVGATSTSSGGKQLREAPLHENTAAARLRPPPGP